MKPHTIISTLFLSSLISSCAISYEKFFPAVTGLVTNNGKPIENAKITYTQNSSITKKTSYQTITDAHGKFSIPEASGTYFQFMHYPESSHMITINVGNTTYLGLQGGRKYDNIYPDNYRISLICDIKNESKIHSIPELSGLLIYYDKKSKLEKFEYSGICITNR